MNMEREEQTKTIANLKRKLAEERQKTKVLLEQLKSKTAEIDSVRCSNAILRRRIDCALDIPIEEGEKRYWFDCKRQQVIEITVSGFWLHKTGGNIKIDTISTFNNFGEHQWFAYWQWEKLCLTPEEAKEKMIMSLVPFRRADMLAMNVRKQIAKKIIEETRIRDKNDD